MPQSTSFRFALRRRARHVIGFMAAAMVLGLSVAGCGYGKISPTTYEFAKALYAVTNRQGSAQLVVVDQQIRTATAQGQISAQESDWLLAIVAQAQSGNWQRANRAARTMLQDQIRAAP